MRTYVSSFSVCLITCSSLVLTSCGGKKQSDTAAKLAAEAVPVEAARVEQGDVSAYYATTATLVAENESQVASKITGIIQRVLVEEGDKVSAGQALAVLDEAQYRLEVTRAEANLARLESDFKRNQDLFNRNLISAEAFDRVRFEMESQKATLELARLNVTHSTIRAPIDGVISQRFVKTGNLVTVNQAVFHITDPDPLQAIIHVPEHELAKIRPGQPVVLHADALAGQVFSGRVERISPVIDKSTGTFKVTVTVRDASARLKPGMFARVRIVYDTRHNTMVMPKAALINEDGRSSVYLVQDSIVLKRTVEVGYTNGPRVEVLSGLGIGSQVVTVGQNSLRDSSKVVIIGNSR